MPSLLSARASAAESPEPTPTMSAVLNLTSVMVIRLTAVRCDAARLTRGMERRRWRASRERSALDAWRSDGLEMRAAELPGGRAVCLLPILLNARGAQAGEAMLI